VYDPEFDSSSDLVSGRERLWDIGDQVYDENGNKVIGKRHTTRTPETVPIKPARPEVKLKTPNFTSRIAAPVVAADRASREATASHEAVVAEALEAARRRRGSAPLTEVTPERRAEISQEAAEIAAKYKG
jgi:hypothetical protein